MSSEGLMDSFAPKRRIFKTLPAIKSAIEVYCCTSLCTRLLGATLLCPALFYRQKLDSRRLALLQQPAVYVRGRSAHVRFIRSGVASIALLVPRRKQLHTAYAAGCRQSINSCTIRVHVHVVLSLQPGLYGDTT